MSLLVAALLVVAVVIVGLYFFVPAFHTALLNAFNVARDSLEKIVADGEALVARLESHAKAQTAAAASHTAALQAHTVLAQNAANNASTASAAASNVKSAIAISPQPPVAPAAPVKV